jgi:hypothetical protein
MLQVRMGKPSNELSVAANEFGYHGNAEAALNDSRVRARIMELRNRAMATRETSANNSGKPSTIINTGDYIPLTKPGQAQAEGQVMLFDQVGPVLEDLEKNSGSNLFGLEGAVKGAGSGAMAWLLGDKAPAAAQEYQQELGSTTTKLLGTLKQIQLALSGKASNAQEVQQLSYLLSGIEADSTNGVPNLSAGNRFRFKGAISEAKQLYERYRNVAAQNLQGGIHVGPGSDPRLGSTGKVKASVRLQELQQQGASPQLAAAKVADELNAGKLDEE